MRRTASAFLVGLLLAAPGWGRDDAKAPTADKLVGEWQVVKSWDMNTDMGLQFAKDGTFKLTERKGPGLRRDGTKTEAKTVTVAEGRYTVEGKTLKMSAKVDGKETTQTRQIKTLTDTALVLADEAGKTSELKKK
jgi:uncharacterized protein (TIGR03066 family)